MHSTYSLYNMCKQIIGSNRCCFMTYVVTVTRVCTTAGLYLWGGVPAGKPLRWLHTGCPWRGAIAKPLDEAGKTNACAPLSMVVLQPTINPSTAADSLCPSIRQLRQFPAAARFGRSRRGRFMFLSRTFGQQASASSAASSGIENLKPGDACALTSYG